MSDCGNRLELGLVCFVSRENDESRLKGFRRLVESRRVAMILVWIALSFDALMTNLR